VETDIEKALYWCEKAAELGDETAQIKMAAYHLEGKYAERSKEKITYWLIQAARQGSAKAEYYLAIYYKRVYDDADFGESNIDDMEEALYWAEHALEQKESIPQYVEELEELVKDAKAELTDYYASNYEESD
jgi:TPR repeat protein